MKTIFIGSLLFLLFTTSTFSQSIFMYADNGTKVYYSEIDSIVQIKFKNNVSNDKKLEIVKRVNPDIDISTIENDRVCVEINKGKLPDYNSLRMNESIVYANKTLLSFDGTIQIPTNKILVKCRGDLGEILNNLNVEYENYKQLGHDVNSYLIILKDGESLNIANKLYESGSFEYAQPSFTRFIELMNEYYDNQWGLNNTGQNGGTSGVDIYAQEAWELTTGCNNVVVAVIDQGVDLDHPDLSENLITGYDATDGGSGGINGDCWGNDAHGTACAGIIAAIDNTDGIIGVSPNCNIIPIRVTYKSGVYEIWDDDWVVDAINHAWEIADADILSCSWRYSIVTAISNEINDALLYGRNSLGCVVIFAAGNYNSSVNYPANSNSDIIAVGAMSPCGERKRSSSNSWECNPGVSPDPNGVSCDGEKWWGSNYGNELDLVAPGVLIPTTDIQGNAGYNTSSNEAGNYYLLFNGTSSATPHVAGVAALILSINPGLTQDQVRDIIESTCTKVGSYSYSKVSGRNNGTWNQEVGYGCVNAYAAVQSVYPKISGPYPSVVYSCGTSFTVDNLPAGATIEWTQGPYLVRSSAQG